MSTKSHTHRRCGTLRKKKISTRKYAEIHIQRPFFDNKKSIQKIVLLKFQMVRTCFSASSTYKIFFFEKKVKISIFGGISKFFKLIVFGHILPNFGSFGLLWADSATMAVVDSMPSFERKKKEKHHNFSKKCQNLVCDGLLDCPLTFLFAKKVSKNPIINWNCRCVPKVPKFHI
jgi:hypothetical protein